MVCKAVGYTRCRQISLGVGPESDPVGDTRSRGRGLLAPATANFVPDVFSSPCVLASRENYVQQQGKLTRQTRCRHGGRRRRRRRRRLPRRTRRPQSPRRQPRRACRTVARGRSLPRPRPSRRPRPTSGGGSQAARGAAPPPTAARRAGGAARAQQAVRDPAGRPGQGRVGVRLRVRVQVGVRVGGEIAGGPAAAAAWCRGTGGRAC